MGRRTLAQATTTAALLLFGSTAAVLLAPASAQAGRWLDAPSSSPLSEPSGVGSTPAVAMNASGEEIVAWLEGQTIRARVRPAGGGAFGAPVALDTPVSGASDSLPSVAIDPAGGVLVTWSEYDGAGHYSVFVASAGPGQPLGPGAAVPGSVGATPRSVAQPLFLGDGTALVLWSTFEGPLEFVRRPPGGAFGAPLTLVANEVLGVAAVPESGDRALVSWTEVNVVVVGTMRTTTYTLKSADLSAAGTVSGRQTIDTKSSVYEPSCSELFAVCTSISLSDVRAAADPAGDGLISYVEESTTGMFFFTSNVVRAAYRVAGGGFEAPIGFTGVSTTLGSIGQEAGLLADGTALVAWEDGQFGAGSIRYAQRSRTGAFPASGQVLASGSGTPRIAALGEDAMLAYVHGGKEVLAQEFAAAGPQGSPVALSANGTTVIGPALGGDGSGDVEAAWERANSGGLYQVEAAGYDAGPRLSGLAVPASGLTGAVLPFAVSALDPLSPVTVDWTFGDGAKATGANVTHAYSTPGAQTASVVATNAAGMTSATLSGVTQVGLAPQSGPVSGARLSDSLKIPKQHLRDVLRHGLTLTVGCSRACTLHVTLQLSPAAAKSLHLAALAKRPRHAKARPVTVGQLTVAFAAAGTKTVHVKLSKRALKRLRHARRLTLNVLETASGAGAPRPLSAQVTLH